MFLDIVKRKARQNPKKIVLPEVFDERTLSAAVKIAQEKTAIPVLLGEVSKIQADLKKMGHLHFAGMEFWNMGNSEKKEQYTKALYELRKQKGITMEEAKKLVSDFNYYAVMMVQEGDADGLISGANSPSHVTLLPALQIIKTKEKFHKVSGFFFMLLEERLLLFADCMVNIQPNSHELADIAIDTAETALRFGLKPKIAMLSFSTFGSAKHPEADKVREAVAMIQHKRPDLICDGEMQVDAAISPEVCKRKYPNAKVCGDANVLIFPDLDSANISYKLVERLAHAKAIGPILQGLKKPVNDLSRGCSVDDIVNLAAITSVEASGENVILPEKMSALR